MSRPSGQEVYDVLKTHGLADYFIDYVIGETSVTGKAQLLIIWKILRSDHWRAVFIEGNLHHLHVDVGPRRTDFRSRRGTIHKRSVQFCIDLDSGRFHADIDRFNSYQGIKDAAGHLFLEVIPGLLKRKDPHA